jgi:hypothetical protein
MAAGATRGVESWAQSLRHAFDFLKERLAVFKVIAL